MQKRLVCNVACKNIFVGKLERKFLMFVKKEQINKQTFEINVFLFH